MTDKELLRGLHQEVDPARLLPPEAALRIFRPLASANDPHRSGALDLFAAWILDREQAVSMNNVAYLWTNFRAQFAKEAAARWDAWSRSSRSCGLATPVDLAQLEGRIVFMTVFKPWMESMRRTRFGRLMVNTVLAAGSLLVLALVFVTCWLAGAAATELLLWLLALLRPARL